MRLRAILPLVAMLAVPAMAQDAHFGLQAGLSFPQSDVKDAVNSKIGGTIGLSVPIRFEGGHTLRPRLDYTYDKGTQDFGPGASADNKVTTTHFGVDYLYNVSGKAGEGFYLTAGIGVSNTKLQSDITIPGLGTASGSDNKSAFAWAAGVGFDFTQQVGLELAYNSTHPDFNGTSINNDSINLSVTFTF